jgi:hypothetical protein
VNVVGTGPVFEELVEVDVLVGVVVIVEQVPPLQLVVVTGVVLVVLDVLLDFGDRTTAA